MFWDMACTPSLATRYVKSGTAKRAAVDDIDTMLPDRWARMRGSTCLHV
jgi:hypothetical protein